MLFCIRGNKVHKKLLMVILVLLLVIPMVFSIPLVKPATVIGSKVTLEYTGKGPFEINIRNDTRIGEEG